MLIFQATNSNMRSMLELYYTNLENRGHFLGSFLGRKTALLRQVEIPYFHLPQ